MQVVILAAGRGQRMKELTESQAKPMLKLKGKPILEHKINALPKKIKEIIFVVGYRCEHIIGYFKHYFAGRRIIYVFQTKQRGTGGALHLAKGILKDKFLVIMGDDLYHKKDLEELIEYDLAILGFMVADTSKFGIIKTNSRGNMVDVIEKPKRSKDKLANTGVYVLNRSFFDYELVSIGGGEFGLPQTLAAMNKTHKIKVKKARAWQPIGSPGDIKKAEEMLHQFV